MRTWRYALIMSPPVDAAPEGSISSRNRFRRGLTTLLLVAVSATLFVAAPAARVNASGAALAPDTLAGGLLASMNAERAAAGLPPLLRVSGVDGVAGVRALDMASRGYFAHFNPDGVGAEQLLREHDVPFILLGENLARSNHAVDTVLAVVHKSLMASEKHRENVLEARFGSVGIAVADAGGMHYFAVVFTD